MIELPQSPSSPQTLSPPSVSPSTKKNYKLPSNIPPSIYFGGAACGISYFLGIVQRMKETWGEDFHTKTLLCGGSVGSIVAIQLAMGFTLQKMIEDTKYILSQGVEDPCYWSGQNHWLNEYVDQLLAKDPTLYQTLEGRFMCGTTRAFFTHQWHCTWKDNTELAKCLKAGYNIPIYCDYCEPFRGEELVDGAYGLDANGFPHGDETLFIGADQTCAELNIESLTVSQMLIPDPEEGFDTLYQEGIKVYDAWDGYLCEKQGKRGPNYPMLMICWIGKLLQIVYRMICSNIIDTVDTMDSMDSMDTIHCYDSSTMDNIPSDDTS